MSRQGRALPPPTRPTSRESLSGSLAGLRPDLPARANEGRRTQASRCRNDVRHRFGLADFLWCPRQAGTPRRFECTRLITPEHVRATLRRLPGFPPGPAGQTTAQDPA